MLTKTTEQHRGLPVYETDRSPLHVLRYIRAYLPPRKNIVVRFTAFSRVGLDLTLFGFSKSALGIGPGPHFRYVIRDGSGGHVPEWVDHCTVLMHWDSTHPEVDAMQHLREDLLLTEESKPRLLFRLPEPETIEIDVSQSYYRAFVRRALRPHTVELVK